MTPITTSTQDVSLDDSQFIDPAFDPHGLERHVYTELQLEPNIEFSQLAVHRLPTGGVCVTGLAISPDDTLDMTGVIRRICGIDQIVNHVVVRSASENQAVENAE